MNFTFSQIIQTPLFSLKNNCQLSIKLRIHIFTKYYWTMETTYSRHNKLEITTLFLVMYV